MVGGGLVLLSMIWVSPPAPLWMSGGAGRWNVDMFPGQSNPGVGTPPPMQTSVTPW